jgi:hypothetical protein
MAMRPRKPIDLRLGVMTRSGLKVVNAQRARYASDPPLSGLVLLQGSHRLGCWDGDGAFRCWDGQRAKARPFSERSEYPHELDLVQVAQP